MKRWLVLLAMVTLLAVTATAQVTFGLGPGVQYSGGVQYPLALSYHRTYYGTALGGAWLDIPVWWKLSVRPGILYSTKEFNATVVYSGPQHLTTPARVKMGVIEVPVELLIHPTGFFYFGGGGYASESMYQRVMYTPLIQAVQARCGCKPPKPSIPSLGNPLADLNKFDWGYVLAVGVYYKIKCPTFTLGNSIDFTFSRGIQKVFETFGRYYANETLAASYTFWF